MTDIFLYVNDRGLHQPYRMVGATHRVDVGPAFKTPREAIDYANRLSAAPNVSPIPTSTGVRDVPPRRALRGTPNGPSLPRSASPSDRASATG